MARDGTIRFLTSAGKIVTVSLENLSEPDRKIIEVFEGKAVAGSRAENTAFDPEKFKELPLAPRGLMLELKPEDFGGSERESMVNALWISLLWWNAFEVMPIPEAGDFERKAAWLLEELTRYIARRGSGVVTDEEAIEGLQKYFSRRLRSVGGCKISTIRDTVTRDPALRSLVKHDAANPARNGSIMSPLILSKLAKGNNIVIIRLCVSFDNGREYGRCAALEHIDEDGNFRMHMYGKRLSGKIIEVPGPKKGKRDPYPKLYEFVVNNRKSLPAYQVENEARYYIIHDHTFYEYTTGLVLRPYVYKTPGKPAPLPKD